MNIIFIIHLIIFTISILIPFLGNPLLLSLYSLLVPFVFWHWAVNDDTCALTMAEMYFTGQTKEKSFFGRLLRPIYKINEHQSHMMISSLYLILWFYVQYRLDRIPITPKNVRLLFKKP